MLEYLLPRYSGLLNSPSDVSIEYHDISRITLTWTSPFTLDITELDNDITYRICDNYTITCAESTITSHSFLTTHLPVEYSVSACNPVGCSENTTLVWCTYVSLSILLSVASATIASSNRCSSGRISHGYLS